MNTEEREQSTGPIEAPTLSDVSGAAVTQSPAYNILKTRDDRTPVRFVAVDDLGEFKLEEGQECNWSEGGQFRAKDLRQRIEPWLTALFQSEHLSLLAGSGLTHAVHKLATGRLAAGMPRAPLPSYGDLVLTHADKTAKSAGRDGANFEDDIRTANELLNGLRIMTEDISDLQQDIQTALQEFALSILKSEQGVVATAEIDRTMAFNTLVSFLMSFASRTATRDRLSIFTTNYDRVLEAGAELAGLHLMDRFVGNLAPIFRSSRLDLDMHYNPPGIRGEPRYLEGVARYSKLHGSIDWVQAGREIRRVGVPFGATSLEPYLNAPGLEGATAHELMIYPNAAKDRETAGYPYVELFRDLASALCRPNSTLVTYGYSFGDEHINRVIEDMLTIPSTHLVVISHDDRLGRIMQTYDRLGRSAQITLLVGPELGDLRKLTDQYLPKSAIDRATVRMSDLLKVRYGTQPISQRQQQETGDGT